MRVIDKQQHQAIIDLVKENSNVTSEYIKMHLNLSCSTRTIRKVLNLSGARYCNK